MNVGFHPGAAIQQERCAVNMPSDTKANMQRTVRLLEQGGCSEVFAILTGQ